MTVEVGETYPLDISVIEAAKEKQLFEKEINRMLFAFRQKTGLEITGIDLIDCRTFDGSGGFACKARVEMF